MFVYLFYIIIIMFFFKCYLS